MFEHPPGHFDSKQGVRVIKVQNFRKEGRSIYSGQQIDYLLRIISYYGEIALETLPRRSQYPDDYFGIGKHSRMAFDVHRQ
jgi:hypothetical protein